MPIHVTEGGGIGINVGGHVTVLPLRTWHALAKRYFAQEQLVIEIARELYDRFVMGGWEPQDAYPQIREWMSRAGLAVSTAAPTKQEGEEENEISSDGTADVFGIGGAHVAGTESHEGRE